MNTLLSIFMLATAILLTVLAFEETIKLFKESKPVGKKKAMTIDEARDRLWKGYTNAYFDFD